MNRAAETSDSIGMDYVGAFRPIFAYAAHMAASAGSPDRPAIDAQTARSDLSLLLGAAMRFREEPVDPNFDQAWFALTAWLDRTLGRLPGGEDIARQLIEPAENREADFFRRLSLLLTPLPNGYPREIRAIIRVYAICLDLGFGLPDDARDAACSREYRRRCRQALATPQPGPEANAASHKPYGYAVAAAAMWLAPVAVPLFLYGLYKFLLGNLYASVVG